MTIRRWLLCAFLCLAIPVQGLASLGVLDAPCPMQSSGMEAGGAALHDCCADADTAAKTGHPCKSGQACKLSGVVHGFSPQFVILFAAAMPAFPSLTVARIDGEPADVWRPPRAR